MLTTLRALAPTLALVASLAGVLGAQQAGDQGPPAPGGGTRTAAARNVIPDIQAHRVEPLSYVRRADERVEVDLALLDLSGDLSDPVITIDGEPVPKAAFARRAIMFGGLVEVGKILTTHITDLEIERLVEAGADPAEFELNPEDQQAKYDDYLALIKLQAEQGAGGDPIKAAELAAQAVAEFEASIEASVGMEKFLNSLSAESRFEKVFLRMPTEAVEMPEDYPEWTPSEANPLPAANLPAPPFVSETTWDALDLNDNTRTMRQLILSSGVEGQPIPAIFKGQITSAIRQGILENMGLTWFFDDTSLPDDVVCRVGDTDITVQQVYPLVAGELNAVDHGHILREMLTLRAMEEVLKAAGQWLDDDAAAAAYREHEAEYEGTLFPLQAIIMFYGYSDLDRYREHYRYRAAYDTWREPELTDEVLEEHYRRGGRLFFEKGGAVVDLAFAGSDFFGGFTPEAFDEAEAALLEQVSNLENEQAWREFASSLPKPIFKQQISRDERTFERNQLRVRLSESALSIFVAGYSMADDIFYNGVPGEIFGPTRMDNRRHGWGAEVNTGVWMGRVANYAANRPLTPMVDQARINAAQDYLDLNYLYWSQECLEQFMPRVGPAPAR